MAVIKKFRIKSFKEEKSFIELKNISNTDLPGDLDLSPDKVHWISNDNNPFLKSLMATRFLLLFIANEEIILSE